MKKTFLTTILLLVLASAPVLAQIGPETPYIRDFKTSANAVQANTKLAIVTKGAGLVINVGAFATILGDGTLFSFPGVNGISVDDNSTLYIRARVSDNAVQAVSTVDQVESWVYLAKIVTLNGAITSVEQFMNAPVDFRMSQRAMVNLTTYDTVAALRATSVTTFFNRFTVYVLGNAAIGDGFGGFYYWDAASLEGDNGISIIKVDTIATGRFKKWL